MCRRVGLLIRLDPRCPTSYRTEPVKAAQRLLSHVLKPFAAMGRCFSCPNNFAPVINVALFWLKQPFVPVGSTGTTQQTGLAIVEGLACHVRKVIPHVCDFFLRHIAFAYSDAKRVITWMLPSFCITTDAHSNSIRLVLNSVFRTNLRSSFAFLPASVG